jgi:hypothetical protein
MRAEKATGASMRDPVAEVAAGLEARLDEVADIMVKRYRMRIESYMDASPEVLADTREWAKGSGLVAIGIITGSLDVKDFIEPLTDVGRRRAAEGFPLHDVLQANLIGTEVLWETVWAIAPDNAEDRLHIAHVMMKGTIELLQHAVSAVSNGYLEVENARVADEEYDMQALVETLAGIRKPDRRHDQRAESLSVDLGSLTWCLVARSSHEDAGTQVRGMRRDVPGAAVGRIGSTIIGYVPGSERPAPSVTPVGIAASRDPMRAYEHARGSLDVALHLKRDCVFYDDVVPLALVLGGPADDREAFVQAQLGPLLGDPMAEDLMKSLQTFYSSGQSVAAAARELFVHRHTLEYRLQRIETLLGRDLKGPEDRLLLELALAIRQSGVKNEGPP